MGGNMAKKELTEALFQARRCGSIWHLLQLIVNKIESLANKVSGFGIVVGSTETVPPGEGASVTATGTKEQPILHFKIPKGDKGEPGPKGDPGPKGEPGSDAQATDVRIAGNSITDNGVADIPIAANGGSLGLIKLGAELFGLGVGGAGQAFVRSADSNGINGRVTFEVISPRNMDYAVKRAMCDGVGAEWSDADKLAARERIGLGEWNLLYDVTLQEDAVFSFDFQNPMSAIRVAFYNPNKGTNLTASNSFMVMHENTSYYVNTWYGPMQSNSTPVGGEFVYDNSGSVPETYGSRISTTMVNNGFSATYITRTYDFFSYITDILRKKVIKLGTANAVPAGTRILVYGR